MAVETILISGVGTDDAWTLDGEAADKAGALSDSDDTTGITSNPNQKQDLAFSNLATADADDTYSGVVVTVRVKDIGIASEDLDYTISDGTSTVSGTISSITGSFANKTITLNTPPSGGSWTYAKVNALTIELSAPNNFGESFYVSKVSAAVTYTAVTLPVYTQTTFQGYEDSGLEGSEPAIANADTDFEVPIDERFRLRLGLAVTAAGGTFKPVPYYRLDDGGGYGAWAEVPQMPSISSAQIDLARRLTAQLAHGQDTTPRITSASGYVTDNNGVILAGSIAPLALSVDTHYEVMVVLWGNPSYIQPGYTAQVKLTNDGVDLDTLTVTPEITFVAAEPPSVRAVSQMTVVGHG